MSGDRADASTPSEDRVVGLMEALERSVAAAKAARRQHLIDRGKCPNCNGYGGDPLSITDDDPESSFYGQPTSPCPECNGTGRPPDGDASPAPAMHVEAGQ